MKRFCTMLAVMAFTAMAAAATRAEAIRIGVIKRAADCPIFVAQEKGYFAAAGLEAELVFFVADEPIALAVSSGDLEIGTGAVSAGLYNLAGQDELRIVAGGAREAPGFPDIAIVASNRAFDGGLSALADLAGRSIALGQIGSAAHYGLGRIAEKYRLDVKAMPLLPLGSVPNQVVAMVRGQADAGLIPAAAALPAVERGEIHLLGWLGDVVPFQLGVAFAAAPIADGRPDLVERFLLAYRRASRDCHDAFTGADGRRADGKSAPDILAILARYTGQPIEVLRLGIAPFDAEARLDVPDIERQIAWFRAQNMVKPGAGEALIVDPRYVAAAPER